MHKLLLLLLLSSSLFLVWYIS